MIRNKISTFKTFSELLLKEVLVVQARMKKGEENFIYEAI